LKRVPECKEWPKVQSERDGFSYANSRKRGSETPFRLASFLELPERRSVAFHDKIPLVIIIIISTGYDYAVRKLLSLRLGIVSKMPSKSIVFSYSLGYFVEL
jgi:hypothetical protein